MSLSKLLSPEMGGGVGMEIRSNTLLTLKGREDLGDSHVYLVGLIGIGRKMEESDERAKGRILIITGNPIFTEGETHHGNKICIDTLPLTRDQRKMLLKSCQEQQNGKEHVYLYIGTFTVGICENARDCQMLQRSSHLNILKLLADYMRTYLVDVDLIRVFPLIPELLRGIITPKGVKNTTGGNGIFGGWGYPALDKYQQQHGFRTLAGVLKGGNNELFRLWDIDSSLIVEMICPVEHWGYYIDIQLVETFVCAPNVLDPFDRSQISRVLVHDHVYIKETASRFGGRTNSTCEDDREDSQLMSVPVMILYVPEYGNDRDEKILDSFIIAYIEYDCRVRLIPNAKPKNIPDEAATVRYNKIFRRSYSFPPPNYQNDTSSSTTPKKSATRPSSMMSSTSSSSSSISPLAYAHCSFPVNLTIMEVDLSGRCRKIKLREIGETYGSRNRKKCGLFFTSFKNE